MTNDNKASFSAFPVARIKEWYAGNSQPLPSTAMRAARDGQPRGVTLLWFVLASLIGCRYDAD
jgi:hypothetical protein